MKVSSRRIRRAILWSAAGALTATMIVAGSSAQAAHPTRSTDPTGHVAATGPGYPKPKGIYKPFTDCPILNPLMQESTPGMATGCVAGVVTGGKIKIGNITTKVRATVKVKVPVAVQFGIWSPPGAGDQQFAGGILPPPDGLAAQLTSFPQHIPGGLFGALSCPNKNKTVQKLCREIPNSKKNAPLYAAAESAGPITNFQAVTWTQPVKFHLINPLLGPNCFIGSDDNPVVVNPTLTGNGMQETDPNPAKHPDTAVLKITKAKATDTTFTAPGAVGCGPGGTANIAIDEALDAKAGLPSATGSNSLTLDGTFFLADCFAPRNMAKIMLSALKDSSAPAGATRAPSHRIALARLRDGRFGFRPQG
jgi:hypothetical protein